MPIYLFASAIDMVALMAVCVWLAGVATFYSLNGAKLTRACIFPLGFLGLVVPLPYSLSLPANIILRDETAKLSSNLARSLNLETAVDNHFIFVDQYKLAIDTACAGLSSTMSLVAVGLLFAYWMQGIGWRGYLVAVLISVPIALFANILRIVVLLLFVKLLGPDLLDTMVHPLSGVLSFAFALLMFAAAQKLLILSRREGLS
jgi:exosortase